MKKPQLQNVIWSACELSAKVLLFLQGNANFIDLAQVYQLKTWKPWACNRKKIGKCLEEFEVILFTDLLTSQLALNHNGTISGLSNVDDIILGLELGLIRRNLIKYSQKQIFSSFDERVFRHHGIGIFKKR